MIPHRKERTEPSIQSCLYLKTFADSQTNTWRLRHRTRLSSGGGAWKWCTEFKEVSLSIPWLETTNNDINCIFLKIVTYQVWIYWYLHICMYSHIHSHCSDVFQGEYKAAFNKTGFSVDASITDWLEQISCIHSLCMKKANVNSLVSDNI